MTGAIFDFNGTMFLTKPFRNAPGGSSLGKKPGGMLPTQNFRNIFTEGMRTFRCHIFCRGAFPGRKLRI